MRFSNNSSRPAKACRLPPAKACQGLPRSHVIHPGYLKAHPGVHVQSQREIPWSLGHGTDPDDLGRRDAVAGGEVRAVMSNWLRSSRCFSESPKQVRAYSFESTVFTVLGLPISSIECGMCHERVDPSSRMSRQVSLAQHCMGPVGRHSNNYLICPPSRQLHESHDRFVFLCCFDNTEATLLLHHPWTEHKT